LRTLLRKALAQVSPAVLRARLEAVVAVDASAALASVKVPVVYLQATQDALVPARAAQLALKACPAMRVVPIRGPHCLLQAAPAETAALVAALVREIESAR
jgi:pimeloyl-ACP methyl ester carboxylesterase